MLSRPAEKLGSEVDIENESTPVYQHKDNLL